MKSVAHYLILIALFLAGTRLVNRQQTYTRSMRVPAPAETGRFMGEPAATTNDTKAQSHLRQGSRYRDASTYRESSHYHQAADHGLHGVRSSPKRVLEAKRKPGKNQ